MRFIQTVALWLLCAGLLQAQLTVVPTVKHLTSTSTPSAGAITLSVSGGTSPYSYTWTPGPVYTKDITNKVKNVYVVKVKDNGSATVTYTYNIGYKADWDQMYGCVSRNDSLIGNASRVWAQAVTRNNLAASTAGFVEYILRGTNETKVFGVLDSLSPYPNTYADIDYGYYYEGATHYLYQVRYGSLYNLTAGYPEGTALRVERSGSTIKFVVNGVTTHTVSDASAGAKVWKVKALLYSDMSGNSFVNMGCSFATKGGVTFKNYSNLVPFIAHSSGSGATDGFIRVKPVISGTYTYTWQPGSVASATLSSKAAGSYSLSAKDATNTISPATYNIGYKVRWDHPYAASIRQDTLVTDNSYSWGSAISKNTLPGGSNGWFEYVLRDMSQYRIIGFTDGLSWNSQDIYDIDFGYYFESGNLYSFGKNGFFNPMVYNVVEGTVLRVERRSDTIEYKINGVSYGYVKDAAATAKDWKVKGTVYGALGSSLVNVGCSFYNEGNSTFPNYNRLVPYITHASTAGSTDGSVSVSPVHSGTYTYTWQPGGSTGSSISSRAAGSYSVTVKDALNHQNNITYQVGYKVQWDGLIGAQKRHDTLIYDAAGGTSWGSAISKNTLVGGNDGWLELVFRNPSQSFEVGFLDSLSAGMEDIYDSDYAFYYDASNGHLYAMAGGLYFGHIGTYPPVGSVLRLERKGDTIRFSMNSSVLASYVNPVAAQQSWKIKGMVLSGTSSLINVGCSFYNQGYTYFPNYTRLMPQVVHSSSPGSNDGSIRVTPRQAGTYSYAWEPGGTAGNTIASRAAGTYTVRVEDALHHSNKLTYRVGYKTYWDSLHGTTVSGDTLKTTGAYMWGRALSKNTLAAHTDGWLEYVFEDPDKIQVFGFLDEMSADPQEINDIDYGFNYDATYHALYTFSKGSFGYVGRVSKGSVLRVERRGDTIRFLVDGIVSGVMVNAADAAKAWKIKGIVHSLPGTKLSNFGCSFGYNQSLSSSPVVRNVSGGNAGEVVLNLQGGKPHYNVAWNSLKVPDNQSYYQLLDSAFAAADSVSLFPKLDSLRRAQVWSGVPSAIYNNLVTDRNGDTLRMTTLVGNDFGWIAHSGVSSDTSRIPVGSTARFSVHYGMGQKLTKSGGGSSWRYAVSDGVVKPRDREFYTEFRSVSAADELALGFKTADSLNNDTTTDMIGNTMLRLMGGGSNTLKIYYNSSLVYTGTYAAGDVMGILIDPVNQRLVYSRNYVPVWTQNAVPASFFQASYQLKALLKNSGAAIKNIIQVGQLLPKYGISGSAGDVTCATAVNGSLSFSAYSMMSGQVPCGYSVQGPNGYVNSGTGTSATLSGLSAGTYTVNVPLRASNCSGSLLTTMAQTYTIAYRPDWINQSPLGSTNVNSTDRSFNITATQSSPFTWLGGASTDNMLDAAEEGWAEFKPVFSGSPISPFTNRAMAFGLNNQDLGTHPSDNDHGFYITSNIPLQTVGLGGGSAASVGPYVVSLFSLGTIGAINNVSPTDVLKIRKVPANSGISMKMEFYKNTSLVGTSSTIPSTELVADVSLNQKDLFISQPRVTFGCDKRVPNYFVLKKVLDAGYYLSYRKSIYFSFEEEYYDGSQGSAGSLSYTIVTDRNVPVSSPPGLIEKIGDNRYSIDLSTVSGMTQGNFYRIAITNKKKEVFYARFKY